MDGDGDRVGMRRRVGTGVGMGMGVRTGNGDGDGDEAKEEAEAETRATAPFSFVFCATPPVSTMPSLSGWAGSRRSTASISVCSRTRWHEAARSRSDLGVSGRA